MPSVTEAVTPQTWLEAYIESVFAVSEGAKAMRRELLALDAGEGTESMDSIYDDLLETKAAPGPPSVG